MSALAVMTIIRCVLLLISLVLGCVGMALPQVEARNADDKFFLMHRKVGGTTFDYSDFACGMFEERFTASLALGIIGLIFVAFTMVLAIVFLISPNVPVIVGGSCCNCFASVFLLTCWALTVAWYDGGATYCGGGVPKDNDYKIAPGLALLISSWCVLAVSGCCGVTLKSE